VSDHSSADLYAPFPDLRFEHPAAAVERIRLGGGLHPVDIDLDPGVGEPVAGYAGPKQQAARANVGANLRRKQSYLFSDFHALNRGSHVELKRADSANASAVLRALAPLRLR